MVEAASNASRMVDLITAISTYRFSNALIPIGHPFEWLNAFDPDELRALLAEVHASFHRAASAEIPWDDFAVVLHEWHESAIAIRSQALAAAFSAPAAEVPLAQPPPVPGRFRRQCLKCRWPYRPKRRDRVNRAWQDPIRTAGENAAKWYQHLCATPMVPRPRRIFPLRGKRYQGAWEYEVAGGKRIFYVPDVALRKVTVHYVGPHLDPAPRPLAAASLLFYFPSRARASRSHVS